MSTVLATHSYIFGYSWVIRYNGVTLQSRLYMHLTRREKKKVELFWIRQKFTHKRFLWLWIKKVLFFSHSFLKIIITTYGSERDHDDDWRMEAWERKEIYIFTIWPTFSQWKIWPENEWDEARGTFLYIQSGEKKVKEWIDQEIRSLLSFNAVNLLLLLHDLRGHDWISLTLIRGRWENEGYFEGFFGSRVWEKKPFRSAIRMRCDNVR